MKIVKENINDYLPSPSEEEIEKRIEDSNLSSNPNKLLIRAAKSGSLKWIKRALEYGANIHVNVNEPLRKAVMYNNLEVVKYLHENGAIIDDDMITSAALLGYIKMLKYLIENSDIDPAELESIKSAAERQGNKELAKIIDEVL